MKKNKFLILSLVFLCLSLILFFVVLYLGNIKTSEETQCVEVIHDTPAHIVKQQVIDIKESKWAEQKNNIPPLTKSDGAVNDCGYTLKWYSSNTLYHIDTKSWRIDNLGFYRVWDNSICQWCYVVAMNSDYSYTNQALRFSFGWCKVLDSGCPKGVVDMYVSW